VLHQTTETSGYGSRGALVLEGNTLYGTHFSGGLLDSGTVFSMLVPPPPLTIDHLGTEIVLSWPMNVPTPPGGFHLQSALSLQMPTQWSPVLPAPMLVNEKYAVTNSLPGVERYYRLTQ
jgi:hypothetical protein